MELKRADRLGEALEWIARGWTPFAGGTDLMVSIARGDPRRTFVDISRIEELRGIQEDKSSIRIGALATYDEIRGHPGIQRDFPMLARAASETGAPAIQSRGTLGGNLANASPAADSPPALIAYGATVDLVSPDGRRSLPCDELFVGYRKTALERGELIESIRLALPSGAGRKVHCYRKVGTRRAQAIAKISFAGFAVIQEGSVERAGVGLGSVAATPVRCRTLERRLRGGRATALREDDLGDAMDSEISPIDDLRSSARYRREVARRLVGEFLRSIQED